MRPENDGMLFEGYGSAMFKGGDTTSEGLRDDSASYAFEDFSAPDGSALAADHDGYFKNLDEWLLKRDAVSFDILNEMLDGIAKDRPIVFISYSHDSNGHKRWVWRFADELRRSGIEVLLDQYLNHGTNFNHFMNFGLKLAYKILVIGTPGYKQKSTDKSCGVGHEETVIERHILSTLHSRRVLPCLRRGPRHEAFPAEIANCYGFDFTTHRQYQANLPGLIKAIWDMERIDKIPLGAKPKFE